MEKSEVLVNKITMAETNFSCGVFKNLTDKETSKISETVQDLFSFVYQFTKFHKIRNNRKVYLAEASAQSIGTDYCGFFEI